MPRFAANISTLFTERPMPERFAAARAAGFEAVEIQFPYEHPAEALAAAKDAAGVEVALINAPPGDMAAGERGLAGLPGREADFRAAVERARDYATALGAPLVHCMAGVAPDGAARGDCLETLAANLAWAADALGEAGIRPTLEAINDRDMPGYLVADSRTALAALDRAGRPEVGFQLDLYHLWMKEGDVIEVLHRTLRRAAHIQFADAPGRHQPGTGEIELGAAFVAIDAMGYHGWIGAEYNPTRPTEQTLAWFEPYRDA